MTKFYEDNIDRIDALLLGAESLFRKKFLETIKQIQDSHTFEELITLLEDGKEEEAMLIIDLAAANIGSASITAFVRSAEKTAEFVSDMASIVINFDQVNDSAIEQMRKNQLRLVTNFSAEQKLATRLALLDGIKRGLNPKQQALLFRDSIGLAANQMQWVINYRELLANLSPDALNRNLRDKRFDRTVRSAIKNDSPLSEAQIDRMVNRFRERTLSYRSENIALTEALTSVHQGVDALYKQAMDDGILDRDSLEQTWNTAVDERRRGTHKPMHKQKRKMGEYFITGAGVLMKYPGDPNAPANETVRCRCMKTTRFKVLTNV